MNTIINFLTVLRGLKDNTLFAALANYGDCEPADKKAAFNDLVYEIFACGAENGLAGYVSNLVICDENSFSRCCAADKDPSPFLAEAYLKDLIAIQNIVEKLRGNGKFEVGFWNELLCGNKDAIIAKLKKFYSSRGYGDFINYKAFGFKGGRLCPIANAGGITLSQLKNYEEEKKAITDNVKDFLGGLPYSNMLLYGDKGTGKSSTVHALVNEPYAEKLRIIEAGKKNIEEIPEILAALACIPLKFILFMDDLSLEGDSDEITELKTILEGSFTDNAGNVMFVATSNRRHIVKENHSDRQNSVHPADSMEEQLSLSDRFGLTVIFSTTDKQAYLSIVSQLAKERALSTDREILFSLAERWAIVKGGRSPRRAKQFTDMVYACEKAGRPIEF